MTSANKIYKASGSKLSFKEWLKREQIKGTMRIHDDLKYVNANGAQDEENQDNTTKTCNSCTPVWMPALAGLVIGSAIVYVLLRRKANVGS